MTKQEAINVLDTMRYFDKTAKFVVEALDMAIEALEKKKNCELTCEGCKFEGAIGGFCDDCCRKYGDMYAEGEN